MFCVLFVLSIIITNRGDIFNMAHQQRKIQQTRALVEEEKRALRIIDRDTSVLVILTCPGKKREKENINRNISAFFFPSLSIIPYHLFFYFDSIIVCFSIWILIVRGWWKMSIEIFWFIKQKWLHYIRSWKKLYWQMILSWFIFLKNFV